MIERVCEPAEHPRTRLTNNVSGMGHLILSGEEPGSAAVIDEHDAIEAIERAPGEVVLDRG